MGLKEAVYKKYIDIYSSLFGLRRLSESEKEYMVENLGYENYKIRSEELPTDVEADLFHWILPEGSIVPEHYSSIYLKGEEVSALPYREIDERITSTFKKEFVVGEDVFVYKDWVYSTEHLCVNCCQEKIVVEGGENYCPVCEDVD